MRYGLLSTVAVAALSLSVAAGVAQQSSSGGSTGSSTGQTMMPQSGGSGTGGAAGAGGSAGGSTSTQQGSSTAPQGGAAAGGSTGTSGTTRQQPSGTASTGTTGSTGVTLSSEQRTQVSQAFRNIRTEPLTNVNFSVGVGAIVPASVTNLQTCPGEVVRLIQGLPECRYIVVRDQIVIVEPSSRRIVTVIERRG